MIWQGFLRRWWWLVALLVFDLFFIAWWKGRAPQDIQAVIDEPVPPHNAAPIEIKKPAIPPLAVGFPTAQTNLVRHEDKSVFMPTASGRAISAHYGSTRTASSGYSSFHEAIDIAPISRNRRGRATDPVMAIADGSVAYINPRSGNSNYGIYVVLEHKDPVGTIYSLYAHLSAVEKPLHRGMVISRGDRIGTMGSTPSSIIPVVRSHLHLEIGMIHNRRFDDWMKKRKTKNLHGRYNGWNLASINPLDVYTTTDPVRGFSMRNYLEQLSVGAELLINCRHPLDYFSRYPVLWQGELPAIGPMVLSISEGGVVTAGRPASAAESKSLAAAGDPVVLMADADVLGRNGKRIVVNRNGNWELGRNGKKWLDILTF